MANTYGIPPIKDDNIIVIETNKEKGKIEAQINGRSVHIVCAKEESVENIEQAKSILLGFFLKNMAEN